MKSYLVAIIGAGEPRHQHLSLGDAKDEAARLLSQPLNVGREAIIYESILSGRVEKIPVPVLWQKIPD